MRVCALLVAIVSTLLLGISASGESMLRILEPSADGFVRAGKLVPILWDSNYGEDTRYWVSYSRDGKRGTPQIIYGLLCDRHGRPVSVEVFDGNLHDDAVDDAGGHLLLRDRAHLL